ncbi:hypothetical protein AAFF_G00399070 [Aldrovandia affinis]|uniref:Uncharacterized protein n=1 Tax=Aldrovandia affinis TaxID=143900 RepID=A0AAD7WKI6_9TELE|nr:hypothetical protein AAFF_G00399070 [Aldrovandia affinis]
MPNPQPVILAGSEAWQLGGSPVAGAGLPGTRDWGRLCRDMGTDMKASALLRWVERWRDADQWTEALGRKTVRIPAPQMKTEGLLSGPFSSPAAPMVADHTSCHP